MASHDTYTGGKPSSDNDESPYSEITCTLDVLKSKVNAAIDNKCRSPEAVQELLQSLKEEILSCTGLLKQYSVPLFYLFLPPKNGLFMLNLQRIRAHIKEAQKLEFVKASEEYNLVLQRELLLIRYLCHFTNQIMSLAVEYKNAIKNKPFHRAAIEGLVWKLLKYLQDGQDPDEQVGFGCTALHAATLSSRGSILTELLDLGTDPNIQDQYGFTPLMVATILDDAELVEKLLVHGADPNIASRSQHTPFHVAAVNRNYHVMDQLVANGATPDNKDCYGITARFIEKLYPTY